MKRNKKSVRVILSGGLGNQLFQFFAALECCEKIGFDDFLFSDSFYNSSAESRTFDLFEVVNIKCLTGLSRQNKIYDRLYFKIANRLSNELALNFGCWNGLDPYIHRDINSSLTLAGYFQDVKLLPSRDKVRSLFFQSHETQREAISIHIRRGDYLNTNNHHYGIVSINDVLSALRTIDDNQIEILIFSDGDLRNELTECMTHSELSRVKFASDFCKNTVHEFSLMRSCRFIICSNSTFSWWAAFSGTPEVVLLPSMWKRNVPLNINFQFEGASIYKAKLI
jgi:hypothetical protein